MEKRIKNDLLLIFEEIGIFLSEEHLYDELDIDSIQYVNIIIAIEEKFLIEINDSYLTEGNLNTFNDFYNLVTKLMTGDEKKI